MLDTPDKAGQRPWVGDQSAFDADKSFIALRREHPLCARLLAGILKHSDAALEALSSQADIEAAKSSLRAISELYSWLMNKDAPIIDAETLFGLLRGGLPMEQGYRYLLSNPRRARKRPISNRRPVLLAVEEKELNPTLSWMQLARKFCQCRKVTHDLQCRERIRIQANDLRKMIDRLGV